MSLLAPLVQAQTGGTRKIPLKIIYSALTAPNAPVWIGSDRNLYEKHGLAVEVVHGRGASPIQALARRDSACHFAGASVISANVGGSDLLSPRCRSGRGEGRRSKVWRI